MNKDISYCHNMNLPNCNTCRRNIKLYSYKEGTTYDYYTKLWFLQPIIKKLNICQNYWKK